MKKLRVLLVDDEIIIREGFKRLFDWARPRLRGGGRGRRRHGGPLPHRRAVTRIIVIMDINIPILNGLKVIQLSRIKHPETAYHHRLRLRRLLLLPRGPAPADHGLHPEARELRGVRRLHRPAEDLPLPAQPSRTGERLRRGGAADRGQLTRYLAGAPGGGHQPQHPGGGVPPERAVYQPALQK